MPYLLMLAAGIIIGKKWDQIGEALKPIVGDVSSKFEEAYSQTARGVGQKFEEFEDRVAEKKHHSRTGGVQ